MVDSLHMLPVMPGRLGTHRSAWISQQPRQSAELAPLQSADRHSVRGMGVVVCRVRQPTLWVTHCTCQQCSRDVSCVTEALGQRGNHVPTPNEPLRQVGFELGLCQGVGGLSKCVSAGQGVRGSPDMWTISLTRQSCYQYLQYRGNHVQAIPECATLWGWAKVQDSGRRLRVFPGG